MAETVRTLWPDRNVGVVIVVAIKTMIITMIAKSR